MLGVGGLLAGQAAVHRSAALLVPATLVLLAGLLLLGRIAPRRQLRIGRAIGTGGPADDRGAARAAVAVVVLTALAALAAEVVTLVGEVTRG